MSTTRITEGIVGNRTRAGSAVRAGHGATPAAAVLELQRSRGNRSVARTLARHPAAVALPGPTRSSWAGQTTVRNRPLGAEIDEREKLTDEALLQERETVAVRASMCGPNHERDVLELEAIEYLAARRALAPLAYCDAYYNHDGDGGRRRNVRFLLEAGIRETGSLEKAAERIEHRSKSVERDISAIEVEANAFGRDFTEQARGFAELMLAKGEKEILRTLRSYGLDPEWADRGAEDLAHQGVDDVVQMLINVTDAWEADSYQDEDSRPRPGRQKRRSLAQDVRALKAQQQLVERLRTPMAALVKHDWQRGEYIPDQAAYDAARRRFEAADRELSIIGPKQRAAIRHSPRSAVPSRC